jgi:Putative zincin peptidase
MPASKINSTRFIQGTLPDDYQQVRYYKIRVIVLQILSAPLFVVFGLFFLNVAIGLGKLPSRLQFGLGEVTLIAIGILLTLFLHELTHGWVMQMFGAKPRYGVLWKQAMFYATTPKYAYRRNDYLLIALAPLFFLSVLFVLGMWFMGGTFWVPIFMICGTINASGAIGDIWISIIVFRYDSTAYVMDERDGIRVFLPNPEGTSN